MKCDESMQYQGKASMIWVGFMFSSLTMAYSMLTTVFTQASTSHLHPC